MPDKEIFMRIKDAILKAIITDASKDKDQKADRRGDKITLTTSPTPVVGRYVQQVKTHNRKSKAGGSTRVRTHQRVYQGYTPIQLPSGQWRMVNKIKKPSKKYTEQGMQDLIVEAIKQEFK